MGRYHSQINGSEEGNLLEIAKLPEDNDMRILKGETEKCIFEFKL